MVDPGCFCIKSVTSIRLKEDNGSDKSFELPKESVVYKSTSSSAVALPFFAYLVSLIGPGVNVLKMFTS